MTGKAKARSSITGDEQTSYVIFIMDIVAGCAFHLTVKQSEICWKDGGVRKEAISGSKGSIIGERHRMVVAQIGAEIAGASDITGGSSVAAIGVFRHSAVVTGKTELGDTGGVKC